MSVPCAILSNFASFIIIIECKINYLAPATLSSESVETEANFEAVQSAQSVSGVLKLNYTPLSWLDNPKYAYHFTLSKFENGTFRLLNYDEEKVNWENMFKAGTRVDGGYYMLVTGALLANGGVLSNVKFFTVSPNNTTCVDMIMREDKNKVQVIGSFNAENRFTRMDDSESSLLNVCGRGCYIVALLGVGQEPTNHALRDIATQAKEFEKWERKNRVAVSRRAKCEALQRFRVSRIAQYHCLISLTALY